MLIYLYLFGLIVGGVLLGSSLILGGGDDGDTGDLDGDLDGDADDAGDHFGHDHVGQPQAIAQRGDDASAQDSHPTTGASADFLLWRFRSLRFWTFFLAFFGLTGLVFEGFGLIDSTLLTLLAAVGMGSFAGVGATEAIRRLSRDASSRAADSHDYIGKSVRVIVPVEEGGLGQVRLQLKGTTVDVLAEGFEGSFAANEEAIIVEMDGAKARIARLDTKKN